MLRRQEHTRRDASHGRPGSLSGVQVRQPIHTTCGLYMFILVLLALCGSRPICPACSCPQRHSIDVSLLPNSNVSTGRCTRLASLAMACLSCQMPRKQSWMLCPWSSCWKGSRQHPGSSPLDHLPTGEFTGTSRTRSGGLASRLLDVPDFWAISRTKRMLPMLMTVLSWPRMEGMHSPSTTAACHADPSAALPPSMFYTTLQPDCTQEH